MGDKKTLAQEDVCPTNLLQQMGRCDRQEILGQVFLALTQEEFQALRPFPDPDYSCIDCMQERLVLQCLSLGEARGVLEGTQFGLLPGGINNKARQRATNALQSVGALDEAGG